MFRKPSLSLAVLLAGLSLGACGPKADLDSPSRPNQPMFVDPSADLKPPSGLLQAGSWFVFSNLHAGDREFGLLVHYLKTPLGATPAIAITDVKTGRYLLDEDVPATISPTSDGFQIAGDKLHWTGSRTLMHVQGKLKSGESFDLTMRPVGPPLAYNGTGYFPLFDSDSATWEYAFPSMETTGTLSVDNQTFRVGGNSWFDRQWFKSMTKDFVTGRASWSWLAAKLSNGDVVAEWDAIGVRERAWVSIMKPDGTLTIADAQPLGPSVASVWTSAKSGLKWPGQWTISAPGAQTKLTAVATSGGQETFKSFPRTESVIHVTGVEQGASVTGQGYAEMVNRPAYLH